MRHQGSRLRAECRGHGQALGGGQAARQHRVAAAAGKLYENAVNGYFARHKVKPGMTGWAAIHGSRGPLDSEQDVRRRVQLDVDYIERQSFWLDLYVIVMTIPCLLGDRSAVR